MNLTLKIWRQSDVNTKGKIVTYYISRFHRGLQEEGRAIDPNPMIIFLVSHFYRLYNTLYWTFYFSYTHEEPMDHFSWWPILQLKNLYPVTRV